MDSRRQCIFELEITRARATEREAIPQCQPSQEICTETVRGIAGQRQSVRFEKAQLRLRNQAADRQRETVRAESFDHGYFSLFSLDTPAETTMTGYTVHTGTSKKFASGWDDIFGDKPTKTGKKTTKKKVTKKPAGSKKNASTSGKSGGQTKRGKKPTARKK